MQTWSTASSHDLPQLELESSVCKDYALLSEQVCQIQQLKSWKHNASPCLKSQMSVLPNWTYLHSQIPIDSQAILWSFIVEEKGLVCNVLFATIAFQLYYYSSWSSRKYALKSEFFIHFLFPLLWQNLWWSLICVMLTHQDILQN